MTDLRSISELLRRERRARIFFAVLAQSALGTGAGYVALLLVAYDRFRSPWAITLVLLADLVPAMALGPLFGAAADRWSRRGCVVAADALRGGAFLGIALVGSFEATIALALLAGVGTGLFTPAALAGLPSLVERRRLSAATALYGAITDAGFTAGPAIAAAVLWIGGTDAILIGNAVTFALSAAVLLRVPFGRRPARPPDEQPLKVRFPLLREARAGVRATAGMPGVRLLLLATAAALFIGGVFNVGELLLAREELDAGAAGFSLLVAGSVVAIATQSASMTRGSNCVPEPARSSLMACCCDSAPR